MSLNITMTGSGPNLVLLHGWSMHSGIWQSMTALLAQQFKVHLVDLPGHGKSGWQPKGLEMGRVVTQLAEQLPQEAHYVGWSLGGLVSIAFAARYPERIQKLVLLAATPKFVQSDDWPCAVEADVFKQFSDNLQVDQAQALQRFLLLQARGAKQRKETVRALSAQIGAAPTPHPDALAAGLDLLIKTDLRAELAALTCPILSLLGMRDTLIPQQVIEALPSQISHQLIADAGHAPFISHPQECAQAIIGFING